MQTLHVELLNSVGGKTHFVPSIIRFCFDLALLNYIVFNTQHSLHP